MPSIYDFKPRFQSLLRPLVRRLAESGVSANHVTIAAVMLSFLIGGLIALNPTAKWPMLLMPVALFIRMALNAIDGMLAREHGMKSALGADSQRGRRCAVRYGALLAHGFGAGNEFCVGCDGCGARDSQRDAGVVAVQIGAARRYDGPMGKSDRAFVFGSLALLLGMGNQFGPLG